MPQLPFKLISTWDSFVNNICWFVEKIYISNTFLANRKTLIWKLTVLASIFVFRSYNRTQTNWGNCSECQQWTIPGSAWSVQTINWARRGKKWKLLPICKKKLKIELNKKKIKKIRKITLFFKKPAWSDNQFGHSLRGSPANMPIRESWDNNHILFFWMRLIEKTYANYR